MDNMDNPEKLKEKIKNNREKDLIFFKHSSRCPISSTALEEFRRFEQAHPEVDCAYIDVLAHRDVSNLLAEIAGITHQSPQAILYYQGKPQWHASHRAISLESLESHCHGTSL